MLRRTIMRRAYNNGEWDKARQLAFRLESHPKEQQLARSIILRSYWNQNDIEKFVEFNQMWGNMFPELEQKAQFFLSKQTQERPSVYHPRISKLHESQPSPDSIVLHWNPNALEKNFIQEGTRVWMIHPHGWVFWDMPEGYLLDSTHPDLLRLTCEILLSPWERSTKAEMEKSRPLGRHPSLAFSAGTDSTAAAIVMPEQTILGYHRRCFESLLDHRNADTMLAHMVQSKQKTVVDVSSNHEILRTYHHKQIGFSTDFASATALILLADHLDIGAIGFGTPLDNTWLAKGRKFRDFAATPYYEYWTQRFLDAGIELLFPIASFSEAGAMLICEKVGMLPFLNSCLRGNGSEGCGKCWKCFHKNGPFGRQFDIKALEIQSFLQRRPLPTATHALWAIQKMNLQHELPDLEHLLKQDFSWWTGFYPPAFEILQARWRDEIQSKINELLAPMDMPYSIENINHFDE